VILSKEEDVVNAMSELATAVMATQETMAATQKLLGSSAEGVLSNPEVVSESQNFVVGVMGDEILQVSLSLSLSLCLCLRVYYSLLLASYAMWSDALDSPSVLQATNHHTDSTLFYPLNN
jgi:hypothetical protein